MPGKAGEIISFSAVWVLTVWYRLLRDGLFCDYTIRFNEKFDFKVHKAQLYKHSGYFRRSLRNSLAESRKRITALEYPACLLARMVLYCYKREDYCLMGLRFFKNRGNWEDEYSDAQTNNKDTKMYMYIKGGCFVNFFFWGESGGRDTSFSWEDAHVNIWDDWCVKGVDKLDWRFEFTQPRWLHQN